MPSGTAVSRIMISICICTFKRPKGLLSVLNSIAEQTLPTSIEIEVIVVDNDSSATGEDECKIFRESYPAISVKYYVEAKSGVSFARNRCIQESTGNWIAFIDDDEIASSEWIAELWKSVLRYQADAVFGPVLPIYEAQTTGYESSFSEERRRFSTGTLLDWKDTRTGNVLFRRCVAERVGGFDVKFAKTGGEDSLFFATALKLGFRLVWCDESIVYETVPPLRMTKLWILRRVFYGGRTFVRINAAIYGLHTYFFWFLHGMLSLLVFILPLFAMFIARRPSWFRYAKKIAGAIGKIVAPWYGRGLYG